MPLYDYDCAACGRRFEVVHGVHVEGPTVCPICGSGPIRKAISAAAVHYKGSGWAKKERRATAATGASKASSEGGSTEGGSTEGSAKADGSIESSGSSSTSTTAVKPADGGTATKTDAATKADAATKTD
jgi:putative FmdB family regulatory protein